eukprot:9739666-Ditylum_brightwellii.AAC.1
MESLAQTSETSHLPDHQNENTVSSPEHIKQHPYLRLTKEVEKECAIDDKFHDEAASTHVKMHGRRQGHRQQSDRVLKSGKKGGCGKKGMTCGCGKKGMTCEPSAAPTLIEARNEPTLFILPTSAPTFMPSNPPSSVPSFMPSDSPSSTPSFMPSNSPSS